MLIFWVFIGSITNIKILQKFHHHQKNHNIFMIFFCIIQIIPYKFFTNIFFKKIIKYQNLLLYYNHGLYNLIKFYCFKFFIFEIIISCYIPFFNFLKNICNNFKISFNKIKWKLFDSFLMGINLHIFVKKYIKFLNSQTLVNKPFFKIIEINYYLNLLFK